jgi:endonuclease YncB( thermonuclease family)
MQTGKQKFASFGIDTPDFTFAGRKLWARVVSVYDGDTITLVFPVAEGNDAGMYKFNARMFGIDTCEMKSKDGANRDLAICARNRLVELITGKPLAFANATKKDIIRHLAEDVYLVWIECLEFDKYGRVLVKVHSAPENVKTYSDVLIEEKLAYPYFGDTKLSEKDQTSALK